jgi:hypothetical protein
MSSSSGFANRISHDQACAIDDDQRVAPLCPAREPPAGSPWRLAWTTAMSSAEGVADRQAPDAACSRMDRGSALSLGLVDPGVDHTALRGAGAQAVLHDGDRLQRGSTGRCHAAVHWARWALRMR